MARGRNFVARFEYRFCMNDPSGATLESTTIKTTLIFSVRYNVFLRLLPESRHGDWNLVSSGRAGVRRGSRSLGRLSFPILDSPLIIDWFGLLRRQNADISIHLWSWPGPRNVLLGYVLHG